MNFITWAKNLAGVLHANSLSARKYQTKPERDTIPDRWPGNTLSGYEDEN